MVWAGGSKLSSSLFLLCIIRIGSTLSSSCKEDIIFSSLAVAISCSMHFKSCFGFFFVVVVVVVVFLCFLRNGFIQMHHTTQN